MWNASLSARWSSATLSEHFETFYERPYILRLPSTSCWLLAWSALRSWRWRHHISKKIGELLLVYMALPLQKTLVFKIIQHQEGKVNTTVSFWVLLARSYSARVAKLSLNFLRYLRLLLPILSYFSLRFRNLRLIVYFHQEIIPSCSFVCLLSFLMKRRRAYMRSSCCVHIHVPQLLN
jgi:hypothetical protein